MSDAVAFAVLAALWAIAMVCVMGLVWTFIDCCRLQLREFQARRRANRLFRRRLKR